MTKKTTLLPVLLIFLSPLLSTAQTQEMQETAAVKKVNETWLNCYPKRDSATLSKILANDFVLIAPDGHPQSRQEVLISMLAPNMETISIKIDSVNARLLAPDIALLNAWSTFVYKYNGDERTGKTCYLDVYVKRKGHWVAVTAHVTALN